MSEAAFWRAEMIGKRISSPVAGVVVAGWHSDGVAHLKVRPDVAVEKAVGVSALSRFQLGRWQ
jgi:hypothetical protein